LTIRKRVRVVGGVSDQEIWRAEAEGIDLDELSDLNLLNHYRSELLGDRIESLSVSIRTHMKREGLLIISKRGEPRKLTERAKRLLELIGRE
jgi:hypothetical protein